MHATVSPTTAQADCKLARDIGAFAKFILQAGGRDFYRTVGELDLTISQIRMLHLLTGPVEAASLKAIADEVGLSLPAVSRAVDSLVQRGLVTRAEDLKDRRHKAVTATGEGRALADHLMETRMAGITDFVQTLGAQERRDLASALAPIVARGEIAHA
jgi:DNA-binding MarR family transcriptional regulator